MSGIARRAQCEVAHTGRYEKVRDYVVRSSQGEETEPQDFISIIDRELAVSSLNRLAGVLRVKAIGYDHLLAPLQPACVLNATLSGFPHGGATLT